MEMHELLDNARMSVSWARNLREYAAWKRRALPDALSGRERVDDYSAHFSRIGSGEPVLMLHGGFLLEEAWAGEVPSLAERFEVVLTDTRGHGRSTLGEGPMSYRRFAGDTAELIESLGLGPCHLVGWSDGGCTGIALALHRPDLLRSLVLVGAPYNYDNYDEAARGRMARMLRPGSPELLALRLLRTTLNPEKASWEVFLERMTEMWTTLPDFTTADLGGIKTPTLVVGADRDEYLSRPGEPLRVFEQTAAAIPGAVLQVVEGGTHELPIEKPEKLNRILLDFLAGL